MSLSLETMFTSPSGFALTEATPAQIAAARIIGGTDMGDLADHPDALQVIGGTEAMAAWLVSRLPDTSPTVVYYLAAARTAKTILSVSQGLTLSQTVAMDGIRPGEIPRVVIVSLTLDHAHAAFSHLVGTMQARPDLRRLIVGKPTANSVMVRHPSGKPIEIKVIAHGEAGSAVVARWIVALIIDEGPRMAWDGKERIQDLIAAARARLLPRGQILVIGAPWAPAGPVYNAFCTSFGKPTRDLVVLHGTGPLLNPKHFTPERCARLLEQDPIAYRSEVLGEFVDGEVTLLPADILRKSQRSTLVRIPPEPTRWIRKARVGGAVDLATRRNGCTVSICWLEVDPQTNKEKLIVGASREYRGSPSDPLSVSKFFRECRPLLAAFSIRELWADQWAFDLARELAEEAGISLKLREHSDIAEQWANLARYVQEGAFELPPDPVVLGDLTSVRQKTTANGTRIHLPTTADGRHCDHASSIALAALHTTRHKALPEPGMVNVRVTNFG